MCHSRSAQSLQEPMESEQRIAENDLFCRSCWYQDGLQCNNSGEQQVRPAYDSVPNFQSVISNPSSFNLIDYCRRIGANAKSSRYQKYNCHLQVGDCRFPHVCAMAETVQLPLAFLSATGTSQVSMREVESERFYTQNHVLNWN